VRHISFLDFTIFHSINTSLVAAQECRTPRILTIRYQPFTDNPHWNTGLPGYYRQDAGAPRYKNHQLLTTNH